MQDWKIAGTLWKRRLQCWLVLSRGSTKCPDFADLQPSPRSGLSYQTLIVTIEPKERIKK
ncbi:MAG: hypothetical protein DMF44_07615 [Verrucomicrobia bacterium]|nr:MAG: hypothetical protein DMF44_07615 [Verrucomicrobiota bacterium]